MLMNKLVNPLFRSTLHGPQFFFSAKKKQMELTLRTPYRINPSIQEPFSKISQDFPDSSPRTPELSSSFRIECHPLFMSFLLVPFV